MAKLIQICSTRSPLQQTCTRFYRAQWPSKIASSLSLDLSVDGPWESLSHFRPSSHSSTAHRMLSFWHHFRHHFKPPRARPRSLFPPYLGNVRQMSYSSRARCLLLEKLRSSALSMSYCLSLRKSLVIGPIWQEYRQLANF